MGSGRFKRQTVTHFEEGYYQPRRNPASYDYESSPDWYPAREATVSHFHRARDYAAEYPSDYRRREAPVREPPVENDYVTPHEQRPREEERPWGERGGAADEYYNHPERFEQDGGHSRRSSSSSHSSRERSSGSGSGGRPNRKHGQNVRPRNRRGDEDSRALRKKFEKENPGFDWTELMLLGLTVLGTVAGMDEVLKRVEKS